MVAFRFDLGWILSERTGRVEDSYSLDRELGHGQFGVVRLCRKLSTGEHFACKSIDKQKLNHWEDRADIRREIDVMRRLSGSPHILELEDVFEDAKYVHLVMELCSGGDLFEEIGRLGCLTETQAAVVFEEIVRGVMHCHERGVLHRDLKPENMLLVEPARIRLPNRILQENRSLQVPLVKLADFGLSLFVDRDQKASGVAGSPFYLAPEVLDGSYGQKADIWSLGVVVFMMLSASAPFFGDSEEEVLTAVRRGKVSFQKKIWASISPLAKDLIRSMLRYDASSRPSAQEVLDHPWFAEALGFRNLDGQSLLAEQARGETATSAVPLSQVSQQPGSPISHLQCSAEFSPYPSSIGLRSSPPSPPELALENRSLRDAEDGMASLQLSYPHEPEAETESTPSNLGSSSGAVLTKGADPGFAHIWGFFGGAVSSNPSVCIDDDADTYAEGQQIRTSTCSNWQGTTDVAEIDWVFGF
eukprot:TRINITY_DN5696_c0_g1_i3.p1 TRINITY_DN5696_c0_g1~~TRINITY_DN5696_c0_g1_i3.p1  ORF type:complete len:473 (+),score=23.10 TRINITY_DN5696_c0_g1_i3:201-1619(+)